MVGRKGAIEVIRILFLGIAGAAALLLSPAGASAQRGEYPGFSRADFEREFRNTSGGIVLAALERNFPDDARALMDRLYQLTWEHRANVNAVLAPTLQEMLSLFQSKAAGIRNAPPAALRTVMERRLELYRMLEREDVALCSRLATAQPGSMNSLPPRFASLTSAASVALIDAAGAGSRNRAIPGRGQLSDADAVAWTTAIQGLDRGPEVLAVLSDPAALTNADPALQCRSGVLTYEATLALPAEASGNVAAWLLLFELGLISEGN